MRCSNVLDLRNHFSGSFPNCFRHEFALQTIRTAMLSFRAIKDMMFADQGLVDDRQPLMAFEIPGLDGRWGFYLPKIDPWKVLLITVLMQAIIQCVFAVIIYYTIVQRRGTVEAYLMGWGIIIPISFYIPFWLMEAFELQNRVVNLGMSTVMTVLTFRSLEAMYGTSPPVVETSLSNYVALCSTVVPFVWDTKTQSRKRISMARLQSKFFEIAVAYSGVSLILSYLKYVDYRPFPSTVSYKELDLTWKLLSPQHIGNAYLHALLVYGTLKTGFELTAFNENIKGFDTPQLFDHPLTKSRTPSEFWTKRWNRLTQPLLKHAVFLPVRRYFNSKIAIFATFVASGLYHDYVWACVFFDLKDKDGHCRSQDVPCYDHQFGHVTLFFAYVGMIMLLERRMSKFAPIHWMARNLPTAIIAHLLLLVHLPVAHWYYGDWIEGGYFDHFAVALWQIKQL